jgi:hypothetical protein
MYNYYVERKDDTMIAQKETFEVGQFAYYSWGYDQTNIDWFKVVKRNEKSIWFVPVPSGHNSTHSSMSGDCVPIDKPILVKKDWKKIDGEHQLVEMPTQFRKNVKGGRKGEICSGDYGLIYPWDGKPKFYSSWA